MSSISDHVNRTNPGAERPSAHQGVENKYQACAECRSRGDCAHGQVGLQRDQWVSQGNDVKPQARGKIPLRPPDAEQWPRHEQTQQRELYDSPEQQPAVSCPPAAPL